MSIITRTPYAFYFSTMEERKEQAAKILSTKLLPNTLIKSPFEDVVKRALLQYGTGVFYEPFRLPISSKINGKDGHTYSTDFLFEFNRINGKILVVDPHGGDYLTLTYLKKLKLVSEEYGLHIFLLCSTGGRFLPSISPEKVKGNVSDLLVADYTKTEGVDAINSTIKYLVDASEVCRTSAVYEILDHLSSWRGILRKTA